MQQARMSEASAATHTLTASLRPKFDFQKQLSKGELIILSSGRNAYWLMFDQRNLAMLPCCVPFWAPSSTLPPL